MPPDKTYPLGQSPFIGFVSGATAINPAVGPDVRGEVGIIYPSAPELTLPISDGAAGGLPASPKGTGPPERLNSVRLVGGRLGKETKPFRQVSLRPVAQ